ncbi:hypothetical protein QYF61_014607 [Mycteria americana]|uniref:Uncharacterized protein n=1 Tax=Mycteria americana TaxID=33587 RepID=A0AAN7N237_MYCAM|nr:hypothetical protein QYF61_014607 [Mycteria americana]
MLQDDTVTVPSQCPTCDPPVVPALDMQWTNGAKRKPKSRLLSIPSSPSLLGVAPTQVQDLALGLVEPHEVHMGPVLKLVQISLEGILSLRRVNCTIQLGVICKLAEGALDPTVSVKMKILNSTGASILGTKGWAAMHEILRSQSLRLEFTPEFQPVQYSSTETAAMPWPSASPGARPLLLSKCSQAQQSKVISSTAARQAVKAKSSH